MIKRLVILFLLISNTVLSQSSEELFTQANALYKEGVYQKAIALYEQIEQTDKVSSELYYNLGNCYYKLNKVAPTIYNYEKALQLNPRNKDAQNNLIFAKRLTLDRIEELPKSFFQKISENYLQKFSYNTWAVIAVLFSFLTAVLFLGYYFSQASSRKRLFFITSIISLLLLLTTIVITYNQYNTSKNNIKGIIFAEEVSVQNEPTKTSDEAFILHEGTKVNIIDTVDDWKKIKLADGKIGWLLSKNIKQL